MYEYMNIRRGQLQITSSGFQFLLHTPHSQLWELLLQYLQMVEVREPFLILSFY
jgi:transcription initiation factor TFIIH subunit 4